MMSAYFGSWKRLAFHGVAAVLFGLATLVWPDITLWALVVLWGAFAFVDGVTALTAAFFDPLLQHRGWAAFSGIVGIAAGVVTFVWPSITAQALLIVIAVWAMLMGGAQIAMAFETRKEISNAWVYGLGGVLLIVLGVLLIVNPGAGALGVTWAIGWLVSLFGIYELWLASEVRREERALDKAEQSISRTHHAAA